MKAILVINEMPSACDDCPLLLYETETDRCKAFHKQVLVEGEDKPIWCPLKPMPKKKDIDDPSLTYDTVDKYIGYNECIEEIEDESHSCN